MEVGTLEEKNLRVPADVADIAEGAVDKPEIDGFKPKETFDEYTALNRIVPYGKDAINIPEIRARGVDKNTGNLESIVKDILGDNIRADNERASKIIAALALEAIKTDGLKLDSDDPTIKEISKYLRGEDKFKSFSDLSVTTRENIQRFYSNAFRDDPTLSNILALKQAVMNLSAAKPGDIKYSKDSPLGKLISYVAEQMDNPIGDGANRKNTPRRVAYLQQQLAQLAAHPRYGLELTAMFNRVLPEHMKLSTAANIGQVLEKFQTYVATLDAQYNAALKKTYNLPDASKDIAAKAQASASGLHGRS